MKKLLLCAVLIGLTTVLAARADQKDEDAAIHKRYDEWTAAWNKHDPHLLAALFTENGDLINPFGKHAEGRQAIEKFFETEHTGTGPMAGTAYVGNIESIRYIARTIAIVDVAGEVDGMKGPDGAAMPPFKHHVTWVAEKKDGKWMAQAARAFAPVPPPAPAPAPAK